VSFVRRMRSCARHRRILPRRSSTAGRSHDRVHRRSSRRLWGRADLPGSADRPVNLPCACGATSRSRQGFGKSATGCGAARRQVFEANFAVYGVRKVRRQLGREGTSVARCTVAWLTPFLGVIGAARAANGHRSTCEVCSVPTDRRACSRLPFLAMISCIFLSAARPGMMARSGGCLLRKRTACWAAMMRCWSLTTLRCQRKARHRSG
jgi:hypothetical protein